MKLITVNTREGKELIEAIKFLNRHYNSMLTQMISVAEDLENYYFKSEDDKYKMIDDLAESFAKEFAIRIEQFKSQAHNARLFKSQ